MAETAVRKWSPGYPGRRNLPVKLSPGIPGTIHLLGLLGARPAGVRLLAFRGCCSGARAGRPPAPAAPAWRVRSKFFDFHFLLRYNEIFTFLTFFLETQKLGGSLGVRSKFFDFHFLLRYNVILTFLTFLGNSDLHGGGGVHPSGPTFQKKRSKMLI